uniref:Uncharacterized protein n=1 Tax=candidate division WOR-3 bacterium TaxID=2052148 RepID=A0A7C4GGS2_UNCW3
MPPRHRLDTLRSIEISQTRLSPRIGCGLMLTTIPRFENSDALNNILSNYGYTSIRADKPAQTIFRNSALLKTFYDNCFNNKTPLRQNFRATYGHLDIVLALDAEAKTAWFIADQQNRIALANYYRDALSLSLKSIGILLLGSTVRLTPVGWQNLYDILTDDFLQAHREIERVEVMALMSGIRWRPPCLGIGLTILNVREPADIKTAVDAALRGEAGNDVYT